MVHQAKLSRTNKMKEKVMQGILGDGDSCVRIDLVESFRRQYRGVRHHLRQYIQRLYWLFAAICLVAPVDVAIGDDVDWRYRADAWGNEMGAWIYVNPKTDALTDRWCAVPKGEVTIPSSINTLPVYGIDSRAFEGCTNMTSVSMPNSIVSMGSGAFAYCYKLKSVSFSANLTDISDAAFSHCTNLQYITLPTRVTSIGAQAFSYCSNLSHIDMPNVSRIDSSAFVGCRGLTSIDFPPTLRYVHNWAFSYATNLTKIVISDLNKFCKITSDRDRIPYQGEYSRPYLYINDMQLTDIVIPEGTTSIADWSLFAWCSGLRSVIIPDSVTYVGKYAFSNTDLESVVMGNGVDEIGNMAFYGCTKLTNVVMGSGVKRIGNNCFQDGRFKEFTIGSNVEKIGSNAFDGCSELETIIFPSTVTNIGSHIFSACFKLSAIYLPTNYTGNTSNTIGSMFESKIIRYVPEQRLALDAHGGSVAQASLIVRFNSAYGALPEPVRDGYVFDGWFYNGERITAQSIVRAINDHELTAAWKPIKYAVAFDANGGTGEMDSIWLDYDSTTNLPPCTFRNSGQVFAGWATNAVGSGTIYGDGAVVSNLVVSTNTAQTLYAMWEPLVVSPPHLSSPSGAEFGTDTCLASLECDTAGAVIYYSTNGVTPRLTQTNAYQGPIPLTDTTTIKAIAFLDGVRSEVCTFTVTKVPPARPTITPLDGSVFVGDECEVTISCTTPGVAIYYSTDGTTPVGSEANRYRGPFTVTRTTTIIAFAANDKLASECVSATISKWDLTLADGAGAPALTFTTSTDAPWTPISDVSSANGYAAKSGAIGLSSATWMETSVRGAGIFAFNWRVDCEHDYSGECMWDCLSVYTNGVLCARIDGTTEWATVSLQFDDNSAVTHVRWEFYKDDYDEDGADYADCAWVGCVNWSPSGTPSIDPIPEITTDTEVSEALEGFADGIRLNAHLTSKAQYDLFRAWVDDKGLDHQAVKDSPRAWFSYAIGANGLVEGNFQSGDVEVASVEAPVGGVFTFKVRVKNVPIGSEATPANLATVFEVQGSSSLAANSFSSKNVNAVLGVSEDGQLIVSATPIGSFHAFFVRVRMYADEEMGDGDDVHAKVQLWEGGPYWATTNIGAENPEDYGYYFWWGDTVGYKRENDAWVASDGSSANYTFEATNTPTYGKDTAALQSEGWITADGVLAPEHDAAQVHWGDGWRMPTEQELDDLSSKCNWKWTTINGVNGYEVQGNGAYASVSIFLPAAGYGDGSSLGYSGSSGYYWSSVPYSESYASWRLTFSSSGKNTLYAGRGRGFLVRPVQGFNE